MPATSRSRSVSGTGRDRRRPRHRRGRRSVGRTRMALVGLSGRDGPRRGDLRTGPIARAQDPQLRSQVHLMAAHLAFVAGALETAASEAAPRWTSCSRPAAPIPHAAGSASPWSASIAQRLAAAGARARRAPGSRHRRHGWALRALNGGCGRPGGDGRGRDFLDQAGVQFSAALIWRARAIVVPGDAGACRGPAGITTFDRLRTMRRELESLLQGAARDEASRDGANCATRRAGEEARKCVH